MPLIEINRTSHACQSLLLKLVTCREVTGVLVGFFVLSNDFFFFLMKEQILGVRSEFCGKSVLWNYRVLLVHHLWPYTKEKFNFIAVLSMMALNSIYIIHCGSCLSVIQTWGMKDFSMFWEKAHVKFEARLGVYSGFSCRT